MTPIIKRELCHRLDTYMKDNCKRLQELLSAQAMEFALDEMAAKIAKMHPSADNMIVLVGGGIRDAKAAYAAAKAGGDIIVTGTVVEEVDDVKAKIQELTGAILKASQE